MRLSFQKTAFRIYSIIFLFCFFSFYLNAQQSAIDSLQKELIRYSRQDSNRVNQFIRLASVNFYTSPDKAKQYIDSAFILSNKIKFLKGLTYTYKLKAVVYQQSQDFSDALDYYYKGISIAEKIKDTLAIASMIGNIGSIQMNLGLMDSAKVKFERRIELLDLLSDKRFVSYELAVAYVAMSELYINGKQFEKAKKYAEKGLVYADLSKIIPLIGVSNQTLGNIHQNLKNEELAISYYNKALNIFEKNNLLTNLPPVLIGLSQVYNSSGDTVMAMNTIERSVEISKEIKNRTYLYNSYLMKSALLIGSNRLLEALDLSAIVYRIKDSILNERNIAEAARKEAMYAADKKEALLQATFEKERAIKQLELTNILNLNRLNRTELELERIEKQNILFRAEQDSALRTGELEREKIAKLAARNKSQEINLLLQKEITTKQLVLLGSIALLLIVLVLFWSYKRKKDFQQLQKDATYRISRADTEMKLLRLQLNPHFIFNSLNSISDYIRKNNIPDADSYLTKFAKLMRGTLESSEEKEISLAEELTMIELYIQLESKRLSNKVGYNVKIGEGIDANTLLIPPLILQPLVENCIWHGLANKKEGGMISIEVKLENNMLVIHVEDNGVGRTSSTISSTNKKSFGLSLTKDRIDILSQMHKTDASVDLVDLQEGTRVRLQLPIIKS